MRLSKIKLAGFKSFVDPTTVHFPSSLVGVVGPNGCGKSNVIDAIRWVMGETSARHLRGDSMEDVIFNGSGSRKPVGTAAIELFFDNSDGSLGGQYASYAEISIRRTISRDGTSQYFLNNTRCRRKDITGMFMGTGLGPRSYAIIEQGMVSRLVEAKPEEMRSYIEEAAGISKYKERRRETETRMQHTRDNLSRLADLRDEVEKQIKHLQRQAQTAERYKSLKQQERQLEAELLAIRLTEIDQRLGRQRHELGSRQTGMEALLADQRQVEADIERARARHAEASDRFAEVQATYYAVQGEIARLEQALSHGRELRDRQSRDLEQARAELAGLTREMDEDHAALAALGEGLADFEPRLAAARQAAAEAGDQLRNQETALSAWQEQWHAFNLDVKEQQQSRTIAETRLEHLAAHRDRLLKQLESVEGERQSIDRVEMEARLSAQHSIQTDSQALVEQEARALEAVERSLAVQREAEQRLSADIEHLRGELESRRGRLETLRTIQNAALGSDEESLGNWLDRTGLGSRHRLVQELVAAPGWTRAVETVLGDFLQGVCVEDARAYLEGLPDTSLVLLDAPAEAGAVTSSGTLADQVQNAGAVASQLSLILCAATLDEALELRSGLKAGQSVVTPDGIWLGSGWVRISRGQRFTGMMAREQEIRDLGDAVVAHDEQVAALTRARADLRREIDSLEQSRTEGQGRVTGANRQNLESASLLASLTQDLERACARLSALDQDSGNVQVELDAVNQAIGHARAQCDAALSQLETLEARGPDLRLEQEGLLADYNRIRDEAEVRRSQVAEIQIEYESRRSARAAAASALERVTNQQRQLAERMEALTADLAAGEAPLQNCQAELDTQLARQIDVQQRMTAGRDDLTMVELAVKTDEARRHDLERQVGAEREAVDALRMEVRELEVRRETLAERFAATAAVLDEVRAQLPEQPDPEQWDQQLSQVRASIERLGPINLAAIDEYSEQSERKTYLDAQHADLSAALETLEHAIRRIDRETRTRFQETFDNINAGLKRIFPRLFGGGHAYLTLEGDEVLNSGVTVMARPPGKRNSHIHLLSGGEKALTAVALIFSIFELNPAPFCILDEVDAPLDEANVGRFCDIVREMSKTVQFIVITHNKTTMEMANQLTGVTMNEPGVSRLVAVDIDEAVKLAAS